MLSSLPRELLLGAAAALVLAFAGSPNVAFPMAAGLSSCMFQDDETIVE